MRENLKGLGPMLVTGGAGFIGSHLVDILVSEGHQVTVIDNLSGSVNWIKGHTKTGRVNFIQGDLTDRELVQQTMAGAGMVWHLGGNTDIPGGYRNTDLDVNNAIIATHNILDAMRVNKVSWLAFPSTGAVYGNADVMPTSETYAPMFPLSLYAAGKLACEALISAYCNLFGLRARIFRFGNVVGARMGHGVIYDFVKKLSRNPRELEILGNGEGEKAYFLVEECIDGMRFVLDQALCPDAPPCDVVNLSGESTTPVMEIAQIVVEEMGLEDVEFRFTGGDQGWPGDQPRVSLDISKLKKMGWRGKGSSNEAVRVAARHIVRHMADNGN